MHRTKRLIAGAMAGALGLAAVAIAPLSAGAAVPAHTTSTAVYPYLVNTEALVTRGATSGNAGTWTAARVVPTGAITVYGRAFSGTSPVYQNTGDWHDITTATVFGLSKDAVNGGAPGGSKNAADFVALFSPTAVSATVQMWNDANEDGDIDIRESATASAVKTISFVAASSVTVTVTPASTYVANNATTSFTVTATAGGEALNQDDDNTAIDTTTANDWTIGAFYSRPSSPAATYTGIAPSGSNPFASGNVTATPAGTMSITGWFDPQGRGTTVPASPTTTAPSAPTGAITGTASVTIGSLNPDGANSTLVASGAGVLETGVANNYRAARSTATVTWTATVKDDTAAPNSVPIANADTVLQVTNKSGSDIKFKLNAGTEKTVSNNSSENITVKTDANGVATLTVEITSPIATGLITAGTAYEVDIISSASAPLTFTAKKVTYEAAGTVSGTLSSATFLGAAAGLAPLKIPNGTNIPVAATIVDTFGNPVKNAAVTVATSGPITGADPCDAAYNPCNLTSFTATVLTDAEGKASITVPGQASTRGLLIINAGAFFKASLVIFGATADVTASSVALKVETPNPSDSLIDTNLDSTVNLAAGEVSLVKFTVKDSNTTPGALSLTPIAFSVTNGVGFATNPAGAAKITAGAASGLTVTGDGMLTAAPAGEAWIYVASTGTGPISVSATALIGGKSASAGLAASNASAPVDSVAVAPAAGGAVPASVVADSVTAMVAMPKDVRGNAIPNKAMELTITGAATFAAVGGTSTVATTDSMGKALFAVRAGASGSFTVTATEVASGKTVTSSSITIAPAPQSITIVAYRSGDSVIVDGDSMGIARGTLVKIRVRVYKDGEWGSWHTVTSVPVKSSGSFMASVSNTHKVRVRAVLSSDVRSAVVTVPRAR